MTIEQNLELLKAIRYSKEQARRLFEDKLREARRHSLSRCRRGTKIELFGQVATAILMLPPLLSGEPLHIAAFGLSALLWGYVATRSYRRLQAFDRDLADLSEG